MVGTGLAFVNLNCPSDYPATVQLTVTDSGGCSQTVFEDIFCPCNGGFFCEPYLYDSLSGPAQTEAAGQASTKP